VASSLARALLGRAALWSQQELPAFRALVDGRACWPGVKSIVIYQWFIVVNGHVVLSLFSSRDPAAGHVHIRRAIERASELTDNAAFFAAAGLALTRLNALRDRDLDWRIADQALTRSREGARTRDLSLCLAAGGRVVFEHGEREKAETAWQELARLAEQTRDASVVISAMAPSAHLALFDGRLEEALSQFELLVDRAREVGIATVLGVLYTPLLHLRVLHYLGRPTNPSFPR
jgi:hypothetical protein